MLVLQEVDLVGWGRWGKGLAWWLKGLLVVPQACVWMARSFKDELVGFGDDGLVLRKEGFTSVIA